jgi:tRNA (guanine37-N1)-methyltransferase
MQENIKLNKVEGKVSAIQGDAKEVVKEKMQGIADRILMPLPQLAYEYLDYAILALKPKGGWIYYYDFEHAGKDKNSEEKVKAKVAEKLQKLCIDFEMAYSRVVRTTGPNWHQIVIDIIVRK